jgi:metal-responsive CopG/Arc/MetJ family transcriptional regulator
MFEGGQQLLHIRLPETLMGEVEEAARLLEEPSITQLIRRAVREFLEGHEEELQRRRKKAAERQRTRGQP